MGVGCSPLSHYLSVCGGVPSIHAENQFSFGIIELCIVFHPSWWIMSCRPLCFLPCFSWAMSFSFAHRLRVCSFPLFCLCKFSSHYIGDCVCCGLVDVGWLLIPHSLADFSLCPCWEFGFSPVLGLCKVAIVFIVSLGCQFTLVLGCFLVAEAADVLWGLLLSCFGHARANNNSGAWFDLNCVSPFVWGCHPVVFSFFTEL